MSQRFSIFLVDDDPHIIESLTDVLTEEGYSVTSASTSEEAISKATKEIFDLYLLDFSIPHKNGYEIFQEIRKIHPHIHAIFITGSPGGDAISRGLEDGIFSCLYKPIDVQELVHRINEIRTHRMRNLDISSLILSDDPLTLSTIANRLGKEGFNLALCLSLDEGMEKLKQNKSWNAVWIDLPPEMWKHVLRNLQEKIPQAMAILINNIGTLDQVVDVINLGVCGYLQKPVKEEDLTKIIERIYEKKRLAYEYHKLLDALDDSQKRLREHKRLLEARVEEIEGELIHVAKMAAMGQLAASIAHELKQPLSAIMGFAELIMFDTDKDSPIAEHLEELHEASLSMSKILNDLHGFSRKSEGDAIVMDIHGSLNNAISLVRHQLVQSDIMLNTYLNPDLPSIFADPNRLGQVFLNLLTNARDALDSKSSDEDKIISVSTNSPASGWVQTLIHDNGIGIPENKRHNIFKAFFTTKDMGKGSGLGLSISRQIVESFGGIIDFYSKEGEGTIFRVAFPQSTQKPSRTSLPPVEKFWPYDETKHT